MKTGVKEGVEEKNHLIIDLVYTLHDDMYIIDVMIDLIILISLDVIPLTVTGSRQ